MRRKAWALAVATALATTLFATAAGAAAGHQTAVVKWHAQKGALANTTVDGASATLVRRDDGVSYRISTNSLTPGHAYTLWLVVVNNPVACDAPQPACTGPELFELETDAQVLYGKGHIAGASGRMTLAGSLREGPLAGWNSPRSFDDARTAEIHLVINDHGPMLPAYMPGMIKTYRGGCSESSPFPRDVFPDTAFNDGEVGPNTCILTQAAVFLAP